MLNVQSNLVPRGRDPFGQRQGPFRWTRQRELWERDCVQTGLNNVLGMFVTSLVYHGTRARDALLRLEIHLIKSRRRNSANTFEVQVLLRNFK